MKIVKFIILIIIIGCLGCQTNSKNFNYEKNFLKGFQLSTKMDKPILIYFTCYGCIGYNEFENDLIASKEIKNKLNEEFITIQLYIDDNSAIQVSDTLNFHKMDFSKDGKFKIKKSRTIGNINAIIEMDLFKNNSQPLYVITDSKRNILVESFGYTKSDKKFFIKKLNEGAEKI